MTSTQSSSYFQGGEYVELLGAQGKTPASAWKMSGKITKFFDKLIKGNAFHMEGGTLQLPKSTTTTTTSSTSLGLTQRYIILQIYVPFTKSFSIEVAFSDFQKIRRRLVFATAFRDTTMTTLHVQIPINTNSLPRDQWMNLVLDVHALTEFYFPTLTSSIRAIEGIAITGSCKLKRVFTMKDAPRCDSVHNKLLCMTALLKPGQRLRIVGEQEMKEIPKQFVFSASASNVPVPTEYFIAASEESGTVGTSVVPAKASTAAVKTEKDKLKVGGHGNVVVKKAAVAARPDKMPMQAKRDHPGARPASSRREQEEDKPSPPRHERRPHTTALAKGTKINSSPHESPVAPMRVMTADQHTSKQRTTLTGVPSRSPVESIESLSEKLEHKPRTGEITDRSEKKEETAAQTTSHRLVSSNAVSRSNASLNTSSTTSIDNALRSDAKQRKEMREEVMAVIQSKLDLLTQEAESEEERDHKLFLKHTSLSLPYSPARRVSDDDERDDGSISLFEESPLPSQRSIRSRMHTAHSRNVVNVYDQLYEDEANDRDEVLHSPEPMVIKKPMNKKSYNPTLAFSSSIFSFSRSDVDSLVDEPSPMTTNTTIAPVSAVRKLFDWESMLANIPPTPKSLADTPVATPVANSPPIPKSPVITPKQSATTVEVVGDEDDIDATVADVHEQHTIMKYPTQSDEEEEDELSRMLVAKKKARQLQQQALMHKEDEVKASKSTVERPHTTPAMSLEPTNDSSSEDEENEHEKEDDVGLRDNISPIRRSVDSASSFDFEMSPVHQHTHQHQAKDEFDHEDDGGQNEHDADDDSENASDSEKQRSEGDQDHISDHTEYDEDEEDEVSLDLTDDLEEEQLNHESTASPRHDDDDREKKQESNDVEQSFDFHRVEPDSDKCEEPVKMEEELHSGNHVEPVHLLHPTATLAPRDRPVPPPRQVVNTSKILSPTISPPKNVADNVRHSRSHTGASSTRNTAPTKHQEVASNVRVASPLVRSIEKVPSFQNEPSTIDRRLASLLESTDWSQFPFSNSLSTTVSPKRRRDPPTASSQYSKHQTQEQPQDKGSRSSSSIELIYDPILRCYYDPVGKKYYALAK